MDAVARLILAEAEPLSGPVLVLDDVDAALTSACLDRGLPVVAFCDDIRDAALLPADVRLASVDDPRVDAVTTVLWRLPKALSALEDAAERLARIPGVRVVAGGRVKHMTRGQNEVLARSFGSVRASLGRDKCRVLHAADPRPREASWPRSGVVQTGLEPLTVWAHGAVFNTVRLDAGTALLLRALRDLGRPGTLGSAARPVAAGSGDGGSAGAEAHDLGCGSGILAAALSQQGWDVTASDVSAAAVASTRLTAEANGLSIGVIQADGLGFLDDASLDLIVTNPPFHRGAAKDSTPTLDALADAGRVLRPGGELWCVFNSHLPYRGVLERSVGRTRVVARDRHYTVTRSVRHERGHQPS